MAQKGLNWPSTPIYLEASRLEPLSCLTAHFRLTLQINRVALPTDPAMLSCGIYVPLRFPS